MSEGIRERDIRQGRYIRDMENKVRRLRQELRNCLRWFQWAQSRPTAPTINPLEATRMVERIDKALKPRRQK